MKDLVSPQQALSPSLSHPVLVHLGCYSKNAIDCGLVNNRNSCLTVLEAGKSKVLADSVSGYPGKANFLLHRPYSQGRRDEGGLWSGFHKGTNPIHEGSTLMT